MKKITISFFQVGIVFLGVVVFVLLLWEPHLEGRNAGAGLFQIYFRDPFLVYAYASSILFFAVLYQSIQLFGNVKRGKLCSQNSIEILRTIRYCAMSLILLICGAEAYLFIVQRSKDDIAGGVAMGLCIALIMSMVAISAIVFERYLQKRF